ncbi:MAG: hypothetical protein IJO65_02345 [Lachnospiraceae bacterium]|nr:hypothetical protein [Lachnospiraceae bacterium]
MEAKNKKEGFSYTYSATEQEEVKRIRQKYQPQEEDKLTRLRRLDASVNQKATTASLASGIIGALIMGSGMSLAMTDLGEKLGLHGSMGMLLGIIIGLVGIVLVGAAYPVYYRIAKKERERITPEILRLTDELLK